MTMLPLLMTSSACKNHAWTLGSLIVLLIGGVIIGVLGKLLAPGNRDQIPFWLTVVCGIVGILLGNWLYVDVFGGKCATSGIDRPGLDLAGIGRMFTRITDRHAERMAELGLSA